VTVRPENRAGQQDTVGLAAATPERAQPYAALGLTAAEYASIAEVARPPADRR